MLTPRQTAKTLQDHCNRYGAGFYLKSPAGFCGRAYGARVRGGIVEIKTGPDEWQTLPDAASFWNHNGRSIGNLPHSA